MIFGEKLGQLGEKLGQLGEKLGQLGEKLGQLGEKLGQLGEKLGQLGEKLGQLGEKLGQLGEKLGQLGEKLGQLGEKLGQLGEKLGTDRMRASFEAMLRQYLPDLIYFATWDYTVVSVTDDPTPLIDANPGDPRLPKVSGLPLRPGPDGGTAIPPIGSQILIGFTRGQRQFPEVRALDPANPPTTVYLGGQAGPGVARLGDVVLAYMPSPCPISGTVTIAGTPSPLVGVIEIPGPLVGAIQVASVIVSAP